MGEHIFPLVGEARLRFAEPGAMLEKLCAQFADHATLTRTDGGARVEGWLGRLDLTATDTDLLLRAASDSETHFSVLRMVVAEHVHTCAGDEVPVFTWTGHGAVQRDIPYFREMSVVCAHQITPRMRRVVLAGDAAHFAGGGLHVRVLIPPPGRAPVWPHAGADGRMVWPAGADALIPRVYTVREVDIAQGALAIDVVLHDGAATPGSDWARDAQAGDKVGLLGPGGGMAEAASWYLFAGDETALPAIARMLEVLPADTTAVVRIEIADAAEEQFLPTHARLDLRWLHRDGIAAGTGTALLEALRAVEWPAARDAAYAFVGCEQAGARAIRAHLTKERGVEKSRCSVAAYWRLGHQGVDIGQ